MADACYAWAMSMPFALPDWLPWWVVLVILVPVLLYLAMFLLMPFSVFGVKGRLELIDARLDEIQEEIRTLSLRLPDAPDRSTAVREPEGRPPIPPSPNDLPRRPVVSRDDAEGWDEEPREAPRRSRAPGGRAEPRLDWPRE